MRIAFAVFALKLQDQRQDSELGQESKKLGDIRTGALAAATIFNATQIAAIKRASTVANNCEGALN